MIKEGSEDYTVHRDRDGDQWPPRSDSAQGQIEYYELKDQKMELVELNTRTNVAAGRPAAPAESRDVGQHREMPIDVPDSFVGVVKQQPRYPPPAPAPTARTVGSSMAPPEPDKMRKYQEEASEKSKKNKDDELLRSSLRGSKKLQQLAKKRPSLQDERDDMQSAINDAFVPDDEGQLVQHKGK